MIAVVFNMAISVTKRVVGKFVRIWHRRLKIPRLILRVQDFVLLEQSYLTHIIGAVSALRVAQVAVVVLQQMLLQVGIVGRFVGTRLAVVHFLYATHAVTIAERVDVQTIVDGREGDTSTDQVSGREL